MSEGNKFFSRENISRAIWALIVAILAFFGGQAYQKMFGAQKVLIDAQATKAQPIYVKIQEKNGRLTSEAMKREIKGIRDEVGKLKVYSNYLGNDNQNINKQWASRYELPSNVKGYYSTSIIGIAEANCVESQFQSEKPIIIRFVLRDKTVIAKATPLIIEVMKVLSKNQVQQVYSGAYELKHGENNIVVDIPLENGMYELRYGYYLLSELNKEYPHFYSKQCAFSVSR